MAPEAGARVTPCRARVDCQKSSNETLFNRFVTTKRGISFAMAQAARSQLPVCEAATTTPRPAATARVQTPREDACIATCPVASPALRAANQRNSAADVPRDRYVARAFRAGSQTPAVRSPSSTCARRIRSTLPAIHPIAAPTQGRADHGNLPTSAASARHVAAIVERRSTQPKPARRATLPAVGSPSTAMAKTSDRPTT